MKVYRDSAEIASSFVSTALTLHTDRLGVYTGTNYNNGQITETVLFNSDKSALRTQIETDINTYYSIY
jgi:hypothetical protein